ncbi:MAG TPA: AlpA family phage regulatory protein [Candidatus Dormibacteraeota bacterium]
MPENPESEGSRLITLKQIELDHGVSRSALHTYRRSSTFPRPVAVEGSTKTWYRADEVAAWFHANPKQQGKKRDQFTSHQQGGQAMATYIATMRIEADSDVTPDQIRQEIYDACSDVPFGFDIASLEPEA